MWQSRILVGLHATPVKTLFDKRPYLVRSINEVIVTEIRGLSVVTVLSHRCNSCTNSGEAKVATQPGIEPRSIMMFLELQSTVLDHCTTQEAVDIRNIFNLPWFVFTVFLVTLKLNLKN